MSSSQPRRKRPLLLDGSKDALWLPKTATTLALEAMLNAGKPSKKRKVAPEKMKNDTSIKSNPQWSHISQGSSFAKIAPSKNVFVSHGGLAAAKGYRIKNSSRPSETPCENQVTSNRTRLTRKQVPKNDNSEYKPVSVSTTKEHHLDHHRHPQSLTPLDNNKKNVVGSNNQTTFPSMTTRVDPKSRKADDQSQNLNSTEKSTPTELPMTQQAITSNMVHPENSHRPQRYAEPIEKQSIQWNATDPIARTVTVVKPLPTANINASAHSFRLGLTMRGEAAKKREPTRASLAVLLVLISL